ncbi:unnamed protein product [Miscanthus lutarioriparius]|uniref:Uncharacterized protein n=1 Tax=Miscanthus lutarioriparius TaxID=422564 RepID=A0A811PQ44_9POAL|nr:unnamed protein product [Miscanthus lutarioriparius]
MAPNCTPSLHGSSRLSRASGSGAMPPPSPPPPALAKKDAQDTLFTDDEFQALMSGQCELLSFSDNDLRSSSPLLSLQLQAQLLCRDDAYARFQETPPPFALDDLEAPISDGDIERLAPLFCDEEIQALFCDEEIQALCAAPAQQASMQFSGPRSDDQAGKKRMSSPPWPSCIADDEEEEEEAGPPPPSPPPRPIKKARTQTKSRSSREHAAAARATRLRHRLRRWHSTIATRILMRQCRAPELSRGRTALRCQCPELALADAEHEPRGFGGCCALHQDALPGDRAWMYSAQDHGAPPLVGGPGEVLVPAVSAGNSRAMVRQYARWRCSVSMPSRFYLQRAMEKGLAQQQPDDDWTMPEY